MIFISSIFSADIPNQFYSESNDSIENSAYFSNTGIIGSLALPGEGYKLVVQGDIAYVADGSNGLMIIDISNVTDVRELSRINLADARDVAVSGNIAYVADGSGGVKLIDINDPRNPSIINTHNLLGDVYGVTIDGDTLYCTGVSGMFTLNVTNTASIVHMDTFQNGYGTAKFVTIAGNRAFIAFESTLASVNVSDPSFMQFLSIQAGESINEMIVKDDLLYCTSNTKELVIFNITNIYSFQELGKTGSIDDHFGLSIWGNYAFTACSNKGLKWINITDPFNPQFIQTFNDYSAYNDVQADGDYLYTIAQNGFRILNIGAVLGDPNQINNFFNAGYNINAVAKDGNSLYVLDRNAAYVRKVNISDVNNPIFGLFGSLPGNLMDIKVVDNIMYICLGNENFRTYDASSEITVNYLDDVYTTGMAYDCDIDGKFAYVADGSHGLSIIDISNPNDLREISNLTGENDMFYKTLVDGNYAYVANYSGGLVVIDISNPYNPFYAGYYDRSDMGDMTTNIDISGDIVALSYDLDGFGLINVSDPTNPTLIYEEDSVGDIGDVTIDGDLLILTDMDSGLDLYDICDPQDPVFIKTYNTIGSSEETIVDGDTAFIADGSGGLDVIEVRQTASDDYDNDLIPYSNEVWEYKTNPQKYDTDGDGIGDYEELNTYSTTPTNPDTDGDGLGDYDEINTHGTSPTSDDSDDDMMPDGWEYDNGLDPLSSDGGYDQDSDGLSNLQEYIYQTDPFLSDTDADGYSDSTEIDEETNPNDPSSYPGSSTEPTNPGPDFDISDYYEYILIGVGVIFAFTLIKGLKGKKKKKYIKSKSDEPKFW